LISVEEVTVRVIGALPLLGLMVTAVLLTAATVPVVSTS